ncbi:MAG: hypothetical protein DDT42_01648 [candidate division WS2 bacterium]|uniref:Uncharacterized protein n=1 Tax=Psychracetigena formicireducens TaxID=2986056 RepID=A0A9E2BHP1_PSYF1|nr:hypothetical protein [Candidatus Psychracetigena formicireducens]MBT9145771.1 hypothetical protein [Candidatus Psychracetigena formicireducens]
MNPREASKVRRSWFADVEVKDKIRLVNFTQKQDFYQLYIKGVFQNVNSGTVVLGEGWSFAYYEKNYEKQLQECIKDFTGKVLQGGEEYRRYVKELNLIREDFEKKSDREKEMEKIKYDREVKRLTKNIDELRNLKAGKKEDYEWELIRIVETVWYKIVLRPQSQLQ